MGREFQIIPPAGVKTPKRMDLSVTTEAVGGIPQDLIEEQHGALQIMHKNSTDLVSTSSPTLSSTQNHSIIFL